jgi:hypothetical protein
VLESGDPIHHASAIAVHGCDPSGSPITLLPPDPLDPLLEPLDELPDPLLDPLDELPDPLLDPLEEEPLLDPLEEEPLLDPLEEDPLVDPLDELLDTPLDPLEEDPLLELLTPASPPILGFELQATVAAATARVTIPKPTIRICGSPEEKRGLDSKIGSF